MIKLNEWNEFLREADFRVNQIMFERGYKEEDYRVDIIASTGYFDYEGRRKLAFMLHDCNGNEFKTYITDYFDNIPELSKAVDDCLTSMKEVL